ncbi:PilT/PilU family type 4a pilus ATPase [Candidatus Dojkabacteria bacterium]|uniref:PilT/PilU family type 4a pilus ATPase n=1 Tax=Candidatus Dojkabacteria bacterium TaxID=2099670 RepID=A0A955L2P3_9BACT|nr:PilT/PilU family type 4a pilus ATPase [Candidatus Dojkabacteria bacterium]
MPDISFPDILKRAIIEEASDIHLTVGHRPIIRIDGALKTLNFKVISPQDSENIAKEILEGRKSIQIDDLKQLDLSYTTQDRRFRVNIFRTMGDISIVMRLIPKRILSIDELELPQILKELSKVPAGLVLLTGPTGSGKSTTLAAVLNYINSTRAEHIITLEDPIEFVFPKGQSLIDQRELGQDFEEWPNALRSILRQDPNVVLVGEMRDHETIASTITVSETGHLVFATLHTNSASQTIDRIIDVFPENQQAQIRAQLSQVLTAVIGQRLVPLPGGGRKAIHEIMIATPAVKNAIREGQTHQIDNMIQTGQDYGMSTLESALVELIRQGLISVQTAKEISIRPEELDILLSQV